MDNSSSGDDERCEPIFVDELIAELELDDFEGRCLAEWAHHATGDGRAYFVNRREADDAMIRAGIGRGDDE